MKKIRHFSKYVKYQRQKQKRAQKASERIKLHSPLNIYSAHGISTYEQSGFLRLVTPNIFSLVNNPERMILFLNRLKIAIYNGKSVVLDFSKVVDISNDGFIALLSVIQDSKVPNNVRVRAVKPKNLRIRKRLLECGISEESTGLESVTPPKSGRFRQKSSLTADTEEANELIQFATRHIYGQKRSLKDVQRILGECIDNTTFHANPTKRLAEKWWGTVFFEEKDPIAYFSILDNGVGIIESLKLRWLRDIEFLLKYKNDAELMRDIFQGGVLSRTGESNRGNGLPNIFRARERNQFSRLICITNNVYVDFDKDEYRLLEVSFSGTFFYWEVRKNASISSAS